MKKFYTSILAALCVFGASAEGLSLKQTAEKTVNKTISAPTVKLKRVESASPLKSHKSTLETYADETPGIAGDYILSIGDYYKGDNSVGLINSTVTITQDNDVLTFSSEEFVTDVMANYNAETGVITFNKIKFGKVQTSSGEYYMQFEPFVYSVHTTEDGKTQGQIDIESYTATYDAEELEIVFPADRGFQWSAYSNQLYAGAVGVFARFDVISMVSVLAEPLDEVQEGQWESIGEAVFEDAWITPTYSSNSTGQRLVPSEHLIHAELQRNVDNRSLYRLWRPYRGDTKWMLIGANQSTFDGQIVFDISDPEHVIVKAGLPSGFKNTQGEYYVFGLLGWQLNHYEDGLNADQMQQLYSYMIEKGQQFDTFDADSRVVTISKSVFDVNKKCENAYSWNGIEYFVSKITLPENYASIGTIAPEVDENAPVEYFNLQGMKVTAPEAGQVVIRRQGSNVSKILVK